MPKQTSDYPIHGNVRLSAKQDKGISQVARKLNVTWSEALRHIIDKHLERGRHG